MTEYRNNTSGEEDIVIRSMKQSLFLNSLEQWIDERISQDGLTDRELIKTIKENFERAMQANVEHYKFMAKYAKENGHKNKVDRYLLMAKIYQSLLQTK